MVEQYNLPVTLVRQPWNKGKLIGAKPPLRSKHVWSIRTKLQIEKRKRDLALCNLAIDSKLRGCDAVSIRVGDIAPHKCRRQQMGEFLFMVEKTQTDAFPPAIMPDSLRNGLQVAVSNRASLERIH